LLNTSNRNGLDALPFAAHRRYAASSDAASTFVFSVES
jgi:hypothetical protein